MKASGELAERGDNQHEVVAVCYIITLADLGLTRSQSSRYQLDARAAIALAPCFLALVVSSRSFAEVLRSSPTTFLCPVYP